MVALDEGNRAGKRHTYNQEDSCQKDHEKIDSLPMEDTLTFLDLKDNIEDCPQRTEHPSGGPD